MEITHEEFIAMLKVKNEKIKKSEKFEWELRRKTRKYEIE